MKKIAFILVALTCFCLSEAKAQVWPYGAASEISITAAGGTVAVTAANNMIVVSSIPTLTANLTLSVTASSQLKKGAVMAVVIKTNGSETTAFAGALAAPTVTGSAGKTWSQSYIYNGTKFYPNGAKIQID